MNRIISGLMLVALTAAPLSAWQQNPGPVPRDQPARAVDVGKSFSESPLENALVDMTDAVAAGQAGIRHDVAKSLVEAPVERLLAPPVNPAVAPGLVTWHANFETACAASEESGKPVFLFHLLGNLDQRFT